MTLIWVGVKFDLQSFGWEHDIFSVIVTYV